MLVAIVPFKTEQYEIACSLAPEDDLEAILLLKNH